MRRAFGVGLLLVLAACGGSAESAARASGSSAARPVVALRVDAALVPRLPVAGYRSSGTYPQLRGASADARKVRHALRRAVLADQRDYLSRARRGRAQVEGTQGPSYLRPGVYRTQLERTLVSASTVVVSALIPRTREVIRGVGGGDGWIGVTLRAPSAERVSISDLFADPATGLGSLAREWRRALGADGAHCFDTYPELYAPSARNYRNFALTPTGLAVAVDETGACGAWVATVPYGILRPHLSSLGRELVAGVRAPW